MEEKLKLVKERLTEHAEYSDSYCYKRKGIASELSREAYGSFRFQEGFSAGCHYALELFKTLEEEM